MNDNIIKVGDKCPKCGRERINIDYDISLEK